ncbi:MAG: PT domain-containing protein [Bacteroidales bacterium]
MVSEKTLKKYGFTGMNKYYEYVQESIVNGQRKQAPQLIKDMSEEQKYQFIKHLDLNQSINQSINQLTCQPTNQPTNQPSCQSTNRPTDQVANQPTDHRFAPNK